MKSKTQLTTIICIGCSLLSGCNKKSNDVWGEKGQSTTTSNLWRNSEEISSREDDLFLGPTEEEFIPLREEDLKTTISDKPIAQPKESPGEVGSSIPGIERFDLPTGALAAIFCNVYFNTDDHILRGEDHLRSIERIAGYLKDHPNCYLFIEGHCDERGPEAYNLSLGARRANFVRSLLAQKGADPNRLYTVSYGKEKPAILGHTPESWAKNRRAQFRIYQKAN